MTRYGRTEGYVDDVDGKLVFFDGDPVRNGVHACHITIEQVRNIVKTEEVRQHLEAYCRELEHDGFYIRSARFKRNEQTRELEGVQLSYDEPKDNERQNNDKK